jgi:hypothetical protein
MLYYSIGSPGVRDHTCQNLPPSSTRCATTR